MEAEEELLAAAAQGDQAAFGSLYEAHYAEVYDFAVRTLRDESAAADTVQTAFTNAWASLRKGRKPERFRPWLFTIAHHAIVDELRRRRRVAPGPVEEEGPDGVIRQNALPADLGSDPESIAEENELVGLFWSAAAALDRQQYALLDLHLRKGLSAEELSAHLGLSRQSVYTRLSRAKDSLERALSAELLLRRGRADCEALDRLASTGAGVLTPTTERAIARHLRDCETCQSSRKRLLAAEDLFAGMPPVATLPVLTEHVWDNPASTTTTRTRGRQLRIPRQLVVLVANVIALGGLATAVLAASGVFESAPPQESVAAVILRDPDDIRSTTHQLGVRSEQNIVQLTWSHRSNVAGYSVVWSQTPRELPDAIADLAGDATSTSSPPLEPGAWAFHLRTQAPDGRWTSTVHICCFLIGDLEIAEAVVPISSNDVEMTSTEPQAPVVTATPGTSRRVSTQPANSEVGNTDESQALPTEGSEAVEEPPPTPSPEAVAAVPAAPPQSAGVLQTPPASPQAPSPTPTRTSTPAPTRTPTPTPTRTPTPVPTSTPAPTSTATPTPSPSPTPSPTPTQTPTPTLETKPTFTPTPEKDPGAAATGTPSRSDTPASSAGSRLPSPTPTPTAKP
jgi:RNA polymerase sigma factor (sigma-70 family)